MSTIRLPEKARDPVACGGCGDELVYPVADDRSGGDLVI